MIQVPGGIKLIYRGIHGYEHQITEVSTHKGHVHYPQHVKFGTFDSGSVRRGFQVFSRNCAACHGIQYKKYDILLDKVYKQLELAAWVSDNFMINPAHHHFKQFYYQEWSDRDRVISDYIYAPYYSQDQAKMANGGAWPTDFSKLRMKPSGTSYVYNILTGYGYDSFEGLDVPKGKHFNPYFSHMIISMPRQLYDGLLDYEDGTPASTPQMAYDVSNFINFVQRRHGYRYPDKAVRMSIGIALVALIYPFTYLRHGAYFRNLLSFRSEAYAVRDGLYYKHWKTGQFNGKAGVFRNNLWV